MFGAIGSTEERRDKSITATRLVSPAGVVGVISEAYGVSWLTLGCPSANTFVQLCLAHGVRVRGIILNKIKPEKLEMVRSFCDKAFQRWGIPLLGLVPNSDFLDR